MPFAPRILATLTLAAALGAPSWGQPRAVPESRVFRQWIAGQEAGGSTRKTSKAPEGTRIVDHEWIRLERMAIPVVQDMVQTVLKHPDGSLEFTFALSLSKEPLEGRASWSPSKPGKLNVTFKGLPLKVVDLPPGVVLWPGEEDSLLKGAARARQPVRIKGYSLPTQQFTEMDLSPVGPDPLPGYEDAVLFKGKAMEGSLAEDVQLWVSPEAGDVRQVSSFAGALLVAQRADLPPPASTGAETGFFERTLKTLPPHPFLPWVREVTVHWQGAGDPALPEDPQQRKAPGGGYVLTRAEDLSVAAKAELPVKGIPSAEDAPFLAATPLVQFKDKVFEGLEKRLAPPPGASRWELTGRVNAFVYDWIRDKDYTVGFASAQEVARNPRGDCTEHGVLAVALLRRMGVPARGVVGWLAMGDAMGLHFWAEARIGGRWYPIDPTFDMVPASAFRIKLGVTDLSDLGSVGWDNAATTFQAGSWVPKAPWAEAVRVQGDTVYAPGLSFRIPGARWSSTNGILLLDGLHRVTAAPRPPPAQPARLLQGCTGRRGWLSSTCLWADCGGGAWLQLEGLTEAEAFRALDGLEVRPARD